MCAWSIDIGDVCTVNSVQKNTKKKKKLKNQMTKFDNIIYRMDVLCGIRWISNNMNTIKAPELNRL